MNIHEYQAKEILRSCGLPVLEGVVASSPEEAWKKAKELGGSSFVVKAQVHSRGRGKAGGIIKVNGLEELSSATKKLLGSCLVTEQGRLDGEVVKSVLIEPICKISKEFMLRVAINRQKNRIEVMASKEANVPIEVLALEHSDEIICSAWDPVLGSAAYMSRKLGYGIGLEGEHVEVFHQMISSLLQLFCKKDCTVIELNPFVITHQNKLIVVDAMIDFDDNAVFRHPDLEELRDRDEFSHDEHEALLQGVSYIKLNGNIGTLVNGAGLAMATLDALREKGGAPANFMDIGGLATRETVLNSFKLLLRNPKIDAILVNVFGGLVKCDMVAQGIVDAYEELSISTGVEVALYVRFEGTNKAVGKKILKESKLNITFTETLDEAVESITRDLSPISLKTEKESN